MDQAEGADGTALIVSRDEFDGMVLAVKTTQAILFEMVIGQDFEKREQLQIELAAGAKTFGEAHNDLPGNPRSSALSYAQSYFELLANQLADNSES